MVIQMNYIIFDLEWNNAYCSKIKKGVNEIIEIGAIKLDENLKLVDTFKQLVKPELTKKLNSRVKRLTHITNTDVESGIGFLDAVEAFGNWAGDGDNLFMSWSNTDLYVLCQCISLYRTDCSIPFIKKYMDVQQYCQSFFTDLDNGNQISLSNAAIKLEISIDEAALHRALADCFLTAECLKRVFDGQKIDGFVKICDEHFFPRLLFKSYYITDLEVYRDELDTLEYLCPHCKEPLVRKKAWENINRSFCTSFACKSCKKHFWVCVTAKQEYKRIVTKIRIARERKKPSAKKRNK